MTPRSSLATKQRILEAATQVFSEEGYRGGRIREICDRGEVNLSAVNYHFGDKRGLYDEVLRYAFVNLAGTDPREGIPEELPAEEKLRLFVRVMLGQLLREGAPATYAKLVAQEVLEPTHAAERLVEEGIRPQVDFLLSILREILPDDVEDRVIQRCAGTVIGQCLFYYFAHPILSRLPLDTLNPESVDPLADHIARSSLAALKSKEVLRG